MNYTLGIDLGVASIGWALIDQTAQKLHSGVRIFPAGLDAINSGKENNRNEGRRDARGTRRGIRRKAERKQVLRQSLTSLGWIPSSNPALESKDIRAWEGLDPYLLRSRAIREKISLTELSRILLHFHQRRGFLSLRKSQDAADKKNDGILGQMDELETLIKEGGYQTLGNYLYQIREQDLQDHQNIPMLRLRNRHLRRQLIFQEFSAIWEHQSTYYPEILTDTLRYGALGKRDLPTSTAETTRRNRNLSLVEQFGLENLLFFQRKVYWPASSIGLCELESPLLFEQLKKKGLLSPQYRKQRQSLEKDIRRAPVADRRFQEFRMLCEINNLRITDDSIDKTHERPLTEEEHNIARLYCQATAKPTLKSLKTKLAKHLNVESPNLLHLNLEAGGRTTLSGLNTDSLMRGKNGLGKHWDSLCETTKNLIIDHLTHPELSDDDIEQQLREIPELQEKEISTLLRVNLGSQRANLSVKALGKLLPHLRNRARYMAKSEDLDSALHLAGYQRSDEQEHLALPLLPRFDDPFYNFAQSITNPVVKRALTELRKVVNGLIRDYGLPEAIHVEMARDLKMSNKARQERQSKTRKREAERKNAAKELEAISIIPNRDAIERYLLWKDQGEQCAYSNQKIAIHSLFSGEIDIDHILPHSRSGDNGYMNKIVCYRAQNAEKGNRTPYEWLAATEKDRYDQILQFASRHLREGGKYKKFTLTEIPEGFTQRALNDTAWIAKAARSYLCLLYPSSESHRVIGTKGMHTSTLRDHWNLNGLLRSDNINLKSRDDHRHHALDAIIIALTNAKRIKAVIAHQRFEGQTLPAKDSNKRIYRLKPRLTANDALATPWPDFRQSVQHSLDSIVVSHRPRKKVSGALHKETFYGKTPEGKLTKRMEVSQLGEKHINMIRDKATKERIQQHLAAGYSLDEGISMPSGVPIRKVTVMFDSHHLTIRENTPAQSYVLNDGIHHLSIFSLGNGKCLFFPTNQMEAHRRKKDKQAIYSDTPPAEHPEAEFLFHLSAGEMIRCHLEEKETFFIFKTMNSNTQQIKFAHHTDATQSNKDPVTKKSLLKTAMPNTFLKNFPNPAKVSVTPHGVVRRSR